MKKRKTGGFLRLVGNSHLFATVVIYFAAFGRRHVGDDGGIQPEVDFCRNMRYDGIDKNH